VSARFVRQLLLPEIGEAGQRRIEASTAAVAGPASSHLPDLAHEVASRYATGAGFGGLEPGSIDVDALAPADLVTDPSAREILAGARAALAEMRRALGDTSHDGAVSGPKPGPPAEAMS
jgi:hypothetical protein